MPNASPGSQKVIVDGSFADWDPSEIISTPANAVPGYKLYGTVQGGTYYIGIQGTDPGDLAIGAGTTIWLNTDANRSTGYEEFGGVTTGAEYNIKFDPTGTPYLYTGAGGQTLANPTPLTFALSADGKSLEIALPASLVTPPGGAAPKEIDISAQITNAAAAGATTYLPGDFTAPPQYAITDKSSLPPKTDTHKVAVVYSDTSAKLYFSQTAYDDLFMAAQNQARMAGVSYDVIDESQLSDIGTLIKYDALVFPAMPDVNTAQLPQVMAALKSAVYDYHIGIITSGDFLTNDQTGAPLPGNAYSNMEALLDLQRVGGGNSGNVTVTATDVANPIMATYAPGQVIQTYANEGYTQYAGVASTPDVLATQNVAGIGSFAGVQQTTTGGTNVHFATQDLLGDSNLLSHAIQSVVLGTQPGVELRTSRQAGIVAARFDMDQSQYPSDVSPTGANGQPVPGIYDKLVPILQQWKTQFGFVGSYYINLGNTPGTADPTTTNWSKSLPYYQAIEALGGEIGNHSYTHLVAPPTTPITETTVGDTPAGSTTIKLSGIPSFAGNTLGLFVSGPGIGTNTPIPGDGGAVATSQVVGTTAGGVTISYAPGGYGTGNTGTIADIPNGTTLTFSIPPENTNFLQTTGNVASAAGAPFTFDYEFNQSKAIEAANLGVPIYGAAVPGATETAATSQNIEQYYQSAPGSTGYVTGGWTGIGSGYPGAIGYLTPSTANTVYLAPNVTFDFTEVQYEGKSIAQTEADWNALFNQIGANAAGTPIVVWPIHDYGAAAWDTTGTGAASPYTTQLYTDFIAQAYNANYEFVTLEQAASRIQAQQKASVTYATSGNVITATATPDPTAPDLGAMSLAVANGGGKVIQNAGAWYAYDQSQVFVPYGGGTFAITLGATQDDVTHVAKLPTRADLLSVSGDGTNLNFSMKGDGQVGVTLRNVPSDIVSIQGAPTANLNGATLGLTFADMLTGPTYAPVTHSVAIEEGTSEVGSANGDIVFGTAGNDVFFAPGAGHNQIHGDGGTDSIAFTAAATNYSVVTNADGSVTVTDLRAGTPDGVDTLFGVANMLFGAPTIQSVTASGARIAAGSGDVNAASAITLTVAMSQAVTVAGGTPTLALNDGGTATYIGGSGTNALTFSYVVAAGQNTPALEATSLALPAGATLQNAAGINAALSPVPALAGTLQIDTIAPTIAGIATSGPGIDAGDGVLDVGNVVTFTVSLSEAATVAGGTPTLSLNNGGTATYATGSGSNALTFTYTVVEGQSTPDLAVTSLNLPAGTTIRDGALNDANLAGATNYNPAGTLQVVVGGTLLTSITTSGSGIANGTGDLNAGKVVTLTANFTQAVTVASGSPTLSLDDGGVATYLGGSGTTALTFGFTVKTGEDTPNLQVYGLNLPAGTTIRNAQGGTADVSVANGYDPAGTLRIDTMPPSIASIKTSGTGITNGTGVVGAGATVTLTATFDDSVTVGAGTKLTLNDGGTATYAGGSGTKAIAFNYVVAPGQQTPDLTVTGLSGPAPTDLAGNPLVLPIAAVNPAGTLEVSTTKPMISIAKVATAGIVTAANGKAGFQISGSSTGIEKGQAVAVAISNSASEVVVTASAIDNGTGWAATVPAATAGQLADGNYTATATAANKLGTQAAPASSAFVVDEDRTPEAPTLRIASAVLDVPAGGSVGLGITATPAEADNVLSVAIKGLPSYEKILAPGYAVTSAAAASGLTTWTVTGKAGATISGISLASSYTGTAHPVANLSVTASNAADGGQPKQTTAAQAMKVTDPPAGSASGTFAVTSATTGWPAAMFATTGVPGATMAPAGGSATSGLAAMAAGIQNVAGTFPGGAAALSALTALAPNLAGLVPTVPAGYAAGWLFQDLANGAYPGLLPTHQAA